MPRHAIAIAPDDAGDITWLNVTDADSAKGRDDGALDVAAKQLSRAVSVLDTLGEPLQRRLLDGRAVLAALGRELGGLQGRASLIESSG
jgi:hypothetical protein